ncbi:MAG: aminopeptidase P family protein [Clostridia bacterium]|nr:aminopeptidase P family protein [Clostridia bacterium]
MNQERLRSILACMAERGLTQMILTDRNSIEYLTGVKNNPMERLYALYISSEREPVFFLNKLFRGPKTMPGVRLVWYFDADDGVKMLSECVDHAKPCGVEKDMAAHVLLRLMDLKAATSFVNASFCVDSVRGRKSPHEAELMRKSSLLNDEVMAEVVGRIREGCTETGLASELKDMYQRRGAETAFTIVAFGDHGADPHYGPGDTVLKPGDPVLLDIGGIKDGYCSDMTRTVFYKSVSPKAREVYELVRKANETAEAMVKPGVRFCDIDRAARKVIEDGGYGEYFLHRLGHSIGQSVHEAGDVSAINLDPVLPGMTFSIEPGIYIPGEVGVRIEDLVLVTEDGCEVLNHYTKELQIIE